MQPKPIRRSLNPHAKALSECDLSLVVERPSNPMSHDKLFCNVNNKDINYAPTDDKVPFTFSNMCLAVGSTDCSRSGLQTHPL